MNASTLCTLLAQRILPEKFQLWGLEIKWVLPEFDTPENRAIVEDVIANYEALVADLKPDEPTKTDLTDLKAATTIAGLKAALVKILEGK